jgi:hypothetical protein
VKISGRILRELGHGGQCRRGVGEASRGLPDAQFCENSDDSAGTGRH